MCRNDCLGLVYTLYHCLSSCELYATRLSSCHKHLQCANVTNNINHLRDTHILDMRQLDILRRMCYDMCMDLCLITIGDIKLSAPEIDIVHLLLEDDDPHWTVAEIAASLPYTVEETWEHVQSLILSGLLSRTDMSQSFENINIISLTVYSDSRDWLNENQQDIDDAFIMLNPDMFDIVEAAEA